MKKLVVERKTLSASRPVALALGLLALTELALALGGWELLAGKLGDSASMQLWATGSYPYQPPPPPPPPPPPQVPAPPLNAFTGCAGGGDDCNLCVPDVAASFHALRDHGDILGFFLGRFPDEVGFCIGCDHWQGVQRLPGLNGQFLAVSQSGSKLLSIVQMGSRNGSGLRYRSNRLAPNSHFHQTAPVGSDLIVGQIVNHPGFNHAGGMQALGNILAVPLENGTSKVVFFDATTPTSLGTNGTPLFEVPHRESVQAGTASLAKLANGRFLLTIGRENANILDFYASQTANLRAPDFQFFDTWNEGELRTTIGDSEFGNYQNLNFLHQCDGGLFLVGTHEDSSIGVGEDWIDLFRVENGTGNHVVITKVGKKHLWCSYPSPGAGSSQQNHCNLDAAGGIYVDPHRNLILYATEHGNDGPFSSVKMMEFRSIRPNPGCESDINQAWVELYDDSNFGDRGFFVDFRDRALEDYGNYDRLEGLEDKISSVRWCIPPGWRYRLHKDKSFKGGTHDLIGSGERNLGSFGDETSSSQWLNQ